MASIGRLERLQAALRTAELDAMIVTSAHHVRYLTGASGSTLILIVTPTDAVVLTHFLDLAQADATLRSIRLRRYEDRLAGLVEVLERWTPRRIGFEARAVATVEFLQWCESFPDAHLLPMDQILDGLRSQADATELASIRQAARLADYAITVGIGLLRGGLPEYHLAAEITRTLLIGGAESLAHLLIQFGSDTSQPQARPGVTSLAPDDLALLDVSPIFDGCRASVARTIVYGSASAEVRRAYATVHQAHRAALMTLRHGATGAQVDEAARTIITAAGLEHYFGHAVGTILHGALTLGPDSTTDLTAGMVVTIGPGIYIPGWGGIRIEDTVMISATGATVLSSLPDTLIELPPS